MKHPVVIKLIMARLGVRRKQVAQKLGTTDDHTLFSTIYHDNLYMNRMVAVLDALGYQLVFQPKGEGRMPEGCYPIRWSDYHTEE